MLDDAESNLSPAEWHLPNYVSRDQGGVYGPPLQLSVERMITCPLCGVSSMASEKYLLPSRGLSDLADNNLPRVCVVCSGGGELIALRADKYQASVAKNERCRGDRQEVILAVILNIVAVIFAAAVWMYIAHK